MIKKAVQEAFNEQIKNEIYSAYLYLSMNAHFTSANLNGFANWMRVQSGEEWLHAMKLYDFFAGSRRQSDSASDTAAADGF